MWTWSPWSSNLEMHLEAEIERGWRCSWMLRSSELRDAIGGHDCVSLEMQLEAMIEWTQRCNWGPWSSEFEDALGGRDRVNSEMHLNAVIEQLQRCTVPQSTTIVWVLGGGRWEACWVLRLYSSVSYSNSHLWECDEVALPLSIHGELACGSRSCKEACRKLKQHTRVNF